MQEFINSMVRHLKNSDHDGRAAANSTFAPDSDQSANVFSPQTVSGHFKTSQPLTNNHSHLLKKMNILITIILTVAGIIALLLIAAFFMKREHYVKREIVINVPLQQVFDFLKLLKNQDKFNFHPLTDQV